MLSTHEDRRGHCDAVGQRTGCNLARRRGDLIPLHECVSSPVPEDQISSLAHATSGGLRASNECSLGFDAN